MERRTITIEGYGADELLALPDEEIEEFVFAGEPIILRIGSAEILGEFKIHEDRLVLELAEIHAGGEGVLPLLSAISERYARSRRISEVEWIVHAVNCADPNLKLRRVLERRGFLVCDVPGVGEAYHLIRPIDPASSQ